MPADGESERAGLLLLFSFTVQFSRTEGGEGEGYRRDFSLSPFSSHGLRGGRGRDTGVTLLSVAARGAIFSFSLAPINFHKLGGRGRNGGRRLLLSEATVLVCMPGSRERERVGRSVSLLWPFNCLLAGGGDKSSGGYLLSEAALLAHFCPGAFGSSIFQEWGGGGWGFWRLPTLLGGASDDHISGWGE